MCDNLCKQIAMHKLFIDLEAGSWQDNLGRIASHKLFCLKASACSASLTGLITHLAVFVAVRREETAEQRRASEQRAAAAERYAPRGRGGRGFGRTFEPFEWFERLNILSFVCYV